MKKYHNIILWITLLFYFNHIIKADNQILISTPNSPTLVNQSVNFVFNLSEVPTQITFCNFTCSDFVMTFLLRPGDNSIIHVDGNYFNISGGYDCIGYAEYTESRILYKYNGNYTHLVQ